MKVRYAITIKCNLKEKYTYRDDFNEILISIGAQCGAEFHNIRYELDERNILHLHAYMLAGDDLKYTSLKCKGWHIYIRKINDKLQRWIQYINKDPREYDQLLAERAEKWAKNTNLFLDYEL